MTATLGEVVAALEARYDPALAEDWDAVGLVCGDPEETVRSVLFAVDPTAAVDLARSAGARRVTLLTYADVPWNAPFYARHGWAVTDDLGPSLRELAASEVELRLARHGRRVAMARAVDDGAR